MSYTVICLHAARVVGPAVPFESTSEMSSSLRADREQTSEMSSSFKS